MWEIKSFAKIRLSEINDTYRDNLLQMTIVRPRPTHSKSDDITPFNLGYFDDIYLYMPRQVIIDSGVEFKDLTSCIYVDDRERMKFFGELKENQISIVNDVLSKFSGGAYGGILQAPPGSGKTVMALNIISELGLKTLVIVHKEFLVEQWIERIRKFIPNVKIGQIQRDLIDIEGKDIVLGMMQSLCLREYPQVYDKFGLVVIDEGHHLGAKVFHKSVINFDARYRLMLTATPHRADGCEKVFEYHIGKVIAKLDVYEMTPKVYIVKTKFCVSDGLDREIITNILVGIPARNDYIAGLVKKAYENGRKVIVFTKRLRHLEVLGKRLSGLGLDYCYFTGRNPDYAGVKKKRVILATVQMAKEGLDIPDIDCEIFTCPQGNVEQDVGRALRLLDGKKKPIVIDIVDVNDFCYRTYRSRMQYYMKRKFEVVELKI